MAQYTQWKNAAASLFKSGMTAVSSLTTTSNGLQPGTLIAVGDTRVQIIKLLAEGGFAFVYQVRDVQNDQLYALKRLLVNDRDDLSKVKEEIAFMKQIPSHRHIVEFRAAGINQQDRSSGAEVLILMEFCPGPSLYEILDQRFKQYFQEHEVLDIFSQICLGVAHLHSLDPPIAHRDLKVENVLQAGNVFKLCDFGSATTNTYHPKDSSNINYIEDEINRYTTMAYRSPEMIDLWRQQLINEKVDIWALGCLLYRICFFLHPFDGGNLQILNVKYQIPANSVYSKELHQLIEYLIEPDPNARPDIFQVLERVYALRGMSCPVSAPIRSSKPAAATPGHTSVSPQASANGAPNATNLFAILDWHDGKQQAPGSPSRSNQATPASPARSTVSAPGAIRGSNSSIPTQAQTFDFDAFAQPSQPQIPDAFADFAAPATVIQAKDAFGDFTSGSSSGFNDISFFTNPGSGATSESTSFFSSPPVQHKPASLDDGFELISTRNQSPTTPAHSSIKAQISSAFTPAPLAQPVLASGSQPALNSEFFFQSPAPVAPVPQMNVNYGAFPQPGTFPVAQPGPFAVPQNVAAPPFAQPGVNFGFAGVPGQLPQMPGQMPGQMLGQMPGQFPPASPNRVNANYYPTSPSNFRNNMGAGPGLFESIAGPVTPQGYVAQSGDPYANFRNL